MSENKRIIAVAGGIGSGKSVVSSILRVLGYDVYDCDREAKRLMNTSDEIKTDLVRCFGDECITSEGLINTKYTSRVVFGNRAALQKINSIVHPRVKDDILDRLKKCRNNVMFVETAILLQSNLLDVVSEVWLISAPESVRLERVMRRNGMSASDVMKRIQAQNGQDYSALQCCRMILNDGVMPVLPQVLKLSEHI